MYWNLLCCWLNLIYINFVLSVRLTILILYLYICFVSGNILSTLVSFDREQRKEYKIPVAITDSGTPRLTGVSILHIVIGDRNDNSMEPGHSDIFVYNYKVSQYVYKHFNSTIYIYDKIFFYRCNHLCDIHTKYHRKTIQYTKINKNIIIFILII